MKLKEQVCSLELAKKLKELGVKGDCLFMWGVGKDGKGHLLENNEMNLNWIDLSADGKNDDRSFYRAFTVAELGEMLPDGFQMLKCCCSQKTHHWKAWMYQPREGIILDHNSIEFKAETEADARAKMLIYLIENKLI